MLNIIKRDTSLAVVGSDSDLTIEGNIEVSINEIMNHVKTTIAGNSNVKFGIVGFNNTIHATGNGQLNIAELKGQSTLVIKNNRDVYINYVGRGTSIDVEGDGELKIGKCAENNITIKVKGDCKITFLKRPSQDVLNAMSIPANASVSIPQEKPSNNNSVNRYVYNQADVILSVDGSFITVTEAGGVKNSFQGTVNFIGHQLEIIGTLVTDPASAMQLSSVNSPTFFEESYESQIDPSKPIPFYQSPIANYEAPKFNFANAAAAYVPSNANYAKAEEKPKTTPVFSNANYHHCTFEEALAIIQSNNNAFPKLKITGLDSGKAKQLIEALKKNNTVSHLDVSDNPIEHETYSLFRIPFSKPGITSLNLGKNGVTVKDEIIKNIDSIYSLTEFFMNGLAFGDNKKVGWAIDNHMKRHNDAFEAVRKGDVQSFEKLIKSTGQLITDDQGNTLLHAAAKAGQIAILQWLLSENNISLNRKNNLGKTPYDLAVENGHSHLLKLFQPQTSTTEKSEANRRSNNNNAPAKIIEPVVEIAKPESSARKNSAFANTTEPVATMTQPMYSVAVEKPQSTPSAVSYNAPSVVSNVNYAKPVEKAQPTQVVSPGSDYYSCSYEEALVIIKSNNNAFPKLKITGLNAANAKKLAKALEINTTVSHLDVSNNPIGNSSAWDLFYVPYQEPRIISLDLRNTNMNVDGQKKITKELKNSPSIIEFPLEKESPLGVRRMVEMALPQNLQMRDAAFKSISQGNLELFKQSIKEIGQLTIDAQGNTLLHEASRLGQFAIAQWLLQENNISLGRRNNAGKTPYDLANENGQSHLLAMLQGQGPTIEKQQATRQTNNASAKATEPAAPVAQPMYSGSTFSNQPQQSAVVFPAVHHQHPQHYAPPMQVQQQANQSLALKRTSKEHLWDYDPKTNDMSINAVNAKKEPFTIVPATPDDIREAIKFYQRPGYEIAAVYVTFSKLLTGLFEDNLDILERRGRNPAFTPNWQNEDNNDIYKDRYQTLRTETMQALSKNSYQTGPGSSVKLLPCWHGTKGEAINSIMETGVANLNNTDDGYFGNGVYATPDAAYADGVYKGKEGALLFFWVSISSAFPIVDTGLGDNGKPKWETEFRRAANKRTYDAHVVLVAPKVDSNGNESSVIFYPHAQPSKYKYMEVVVFNPAQVLPRFLVETRKIEPMTVPLSAGEKAFADAWKAIDVKNYELAMRHYADAWKAIDVKNYELAMRHYADAAYKGFQPAAYVLGLMYFHGIGVPQNAQLTAEENIQQNQETARTWFVYVKQNDTKGFLKHANYALGFLFDFNEGIPNRIEKACQNYSEVQTENLPSRLRLLKLVNRYQPEFFYRDRNNLLFFHWNKRGVEPVRVNALKTPTPGFGNKN